ncbi:MAG: HypC/HybG/HupF family hydrogenase formation chaperone [Acidimicrobiia bacterium]
MTDGSIQGFGHALARASLALARRFSAGATMWCTSPATPWHAHHLAVEFVHPVIMGKRALPAVAVPPEDPIAALRANVRTGDVIAAVAPADDPVVAEVMARAAAWGATTLWIGFGEPSRTGFADHPLSLDTPSDDAVVRTYHLLWELTHVCFEHPGLLQVEECAEEVCITCSDEGRLGEVEVVQEDEAVVRTADGRERISTAFIDPPALGDLVLVHAGTAITKVDL